MHFWPFSWQTGLTFPWENDILKLPNSISQWIEIVSEIFFLFSYAVSWYIILYFTYWICGQITYHIDLDRGLWFVIGLLFRKNFDPLCNTKGGLLGLFQKFPSSNQPKSTNFIGIFEQYFLLQNYVHLGNLKSIL